MHSTELIRRLMDAYATYCVDPDDKAAADEFWAAMDAAYAARMDIAESMGETWMHEVPADR